MTSKGTLLENGPIYTNNETVIESKETLQQRVDKINGYNPGKGFLRLALVENTAVIVDAMERITDYFAKKDHE